VLVIGDHFHPNKMFDADQGLYSQVTTLYFLRNSRMGPIRRSVTLHYTGKACQWQTH